ncbi:MAG: hypothetical protein ACP5D6_09045 [Kosmotogaceae bacterium]
MPRKVDLDKAIEKLQFITIADLNKEINIGRILLDDYDGIERDLCLFLVQGYFDEILKDTGEMNRHGTEKALVYAKWYATRRLSSEKEGLSGVVERSKLYMLNDAEKTGWHHALEYNDVAELLASILEGKEGSDEAYDWKFIVEQLMPAAEHANIPADTVMRASLNVRKIRGMVPAARELLKRQKNDELDTKEAENTLKGWLEKAVDQNVTSAGFKEELDQWRGLSVNRKDPITGYRIIQPNGKPILCIELDGDGQATMIEQALRNRVNIQNTGWDWLQSKVLSQTNTYKLDSYIREEVL